MRRSTQLTCVAIFLIIGMVFAKHYGFDVSPFGVVLLVLSFLALVMLRGSWLSILPLATLAFLIGAVRYSFFTTGFPANSIDIYQYSKQTVVGVVDGEPYRDKEMNYVFHLESLSIDGERFAGNLRVKSLVANAKEGYTVQVYGKIMPSMGRASSGMSYAKVVVLSTHRPVLVQTKGTFTAGVRRALPEPAAGFVLGILIGSRSALPTELQEVMSKIGLSHLVAVSGYNLTIIALAIQALLGRKWQWGTLLATLWLIVGFVVLTGASASIVRAGIMSALFLVAHYYGRKLQVISCLAAGLIVTLMWNPEYLIDLGWQLSFLALAGIVLLTPALRKLIPAKFGTLGDIAAASVAAQLATLPLIAYVFGNIALIAPLANIVFLPLVPMLMLFGFLAGIIGMLLPTYAYALFWPLRAIIDFLLRGMSMLANMHFASVQNASPPTLLLGLFYGLLTTLALLARRKLGYLGSTAVDDIITGIKREKSL